MYLPKNYFDFFPKVIVLFISFIIFSLIPRLSIAETSITSYCQLSIQSLQQQVSNFQELITLANQYSDDPEGFSSAEAAKQAEFEEETAALMASYDMTPEEYALYMGKHKEEVEAYWQENPALKQQLDDLSAQAMALMNEFETITGLSTPDVAPLQ